MFVLSGRRAYTPPVPAKLLCLRAERKPLAARGTSATKGGAVRPAKNSTGNRPRAIYLIFSASLPHQWWVGPTMEEKRKHPRTEINEPAFVSSGGSVMSCTVRNISPEGAAIDVENPAFVPQHFRLVMANGSSVRECRITWIQQKRIGVTFVAVPQ
jgi:PilZ domain